MLYSCTRMATVGVKGLITVNAARDILPVLNVPRFTVPTAISLLYLSSCSLLWLSVVISMEHGQEIMLMYDSIVISKW